MKKSSKHFYTLGEKKRFSSSNQTQSYSDPGMKVPCVIIAVICSLIALSEQASLVGNSDNQKDKFRALVLGNGEAPAYTIVDRRAPNIELRSYYPGKNQRLIKRNLTQFNALY